MKNVKQCLVNFDPLTAIAIIMAMLPRKVKTIMMLKTVILTKSKPGSDNVFSLSRQSDMFPFSFVMADVQFCTDRNLK